MDKIFNRKNISAFVFITLLLSVAFIIIKIIFAPSSVNLLDETVRIKSDYTLMLIQCILGLVAMFLPALLSKNLKIEIPNNMIILYVVFLYAAIFLGEVRNFYYDIPHWDTILHGFSGAMIGALGFSVISLLNKSKSVKLSPLFVALFSFCFAITLGVAWEIYEYSFDIILGLNMQKFATYDGTILIGQAALGDTMKDLIVDCLGAGVMSVIGYISLKYKKHWIENLLIKKVK
ncbi:MAG: hypothetical protein RR290_02435 [Clostridia bacterium]